MMPSYRRLVAILFFLLPFSSPQSTPPPSIARHKINGDAYFIRGSCPSNNTDAKFLKEEGRYLVSEQCDVVIHSRRQLQKLFVEIDIQYIPTISGSTKLNPTKSITIEQGKLNIECKSDGVKTINSDPTFTIAPSPIVYFTDHRLFCSFIVKTSHDTFPLVTATFKLELKFHSKAGNEEVLTYPYPLWNRGELFCDSVEMFDREDSEFFLKKAEIEMTDGKIIECPLETTGKLFLEIDSSSLRLVDYIDCKSGKWTWNLGNNNGEISKKFRVSCGIRVCSQCTEDVLTEFECPSCSKATFTKLFDECSQIKCTSNKWMLDGKWANKPTMKCVKNSGGSYGWTANGIDVKEGSCTSKFDCVTHSEMKLTCNAKKGLCQDVTLSADRMTISCDETNEFFLGYGNVSARPERILECDDNMGIFRDGLDDAPTKQTLGCYKVRGRTRRRKKSSASSSKTATGSIPLYSWLPIVIIALIVLIGGAILFFFMKRRESMEETEGDDQLSKDQSQSKTTETDGILVTNRAAVVRDSTRVKLTKADSEIVKEERIIKSESSQSDRDFNIEKTETEASTESSNSTKTTRSRTTGQVNIVPFYHFKRELNKNLVAPLIEPFIITKANMIPAPRNAKNCPDWYSTAMDVPNPRLRERARTVSTNMNQQSGATTGDGTTTNQQSGMTADGTTTGNQQTGTTAEGTTTGNQTGTTVDGTTTGNQTGTTADGTTTNQQSGATQSGASGANSSSENKKSV